MKEKKTFFAQSDFTMQWLHFSTQHHLLVYSITALIFGVLSIGLTYIFFVKNLAFSLQTAIYGALLLLSIFFPFILTAIALRRLIYFILDTIRVQPTYNAKRATFLFLLRDLESIFNALREMRTDRGATFERLQLLSFIRICFLVFSGRYIGIDSSTPSQFKQRYEGYLDAHASYRRNHPEINTKRILICERADLDSDRYKNPEAWHEFIKWHEDNKVALHICRRTDAEKIQQKYGLESSDIAFWEDEAAFLFIPENNGRVRLKMALKGERLYDICKNYVEEIERRAEPPEMLSVMPRALIEKWDEFVFPLARVQTSIPFIEQVIQNVAQRTGVQLNRLQIIDAGAGLGVEAAELLQKGYDVVINEIDPLFREKCRNYIRATLGKDVPDSKVWSIDWRRFTNHFGSESFDICLVLGNSLCLLADANDIREVIEQFHNILRPGGALIVDERNFEYIWREWGKTINPKNPSQTYRYSRRVIYCGTNVRGYPIEIQQAKRRILFKYDALHDDQWEEKATISLYGFRFGELFDMLHQHFNEVHAFADLQEEITSAVAAKNFDGDHAKADFFTYVAYKR